MGIHAAVIAPYPGARVFAHRPVQYLDNQAPLLAPLTGGSSNPYYHEYQGNPAAGYPVAGYPVAAAPYVGSGGYGRYGFPLYG